MAEPTVIPAGGGEIIGDTPDRRVEVLSDHDALHATWSRFGPRRDGADLHIHHHHTDLFYVLDGELTVRLGAEDEHVVVPAGQLARVPPFVVHGFRNASDAPVTYLNLHAPGCGFIGFMRGIRDGRPIDFDQAEPPADGGRPLSEAVVGEPFADVDAIAVAEVRLADAEERAFGDRLAALYVLSGELAVGSQRAGEGAWVLVPPGVAHTVAPAGGEAVRLLDVRAPVV